MGLSQREALRELKQACQANDVERTKIALLHWAKVRWPDQPPRSVLGVAARIDHRDTCHVLEKFDQCLYRNTSEDWDGELLYREISTALKDKTGQIKSGLKKQVLTELYPV